MKNILFCVFLLCQITSEAQELNINQLDSLYDSFLEMRRNNDNSNQSEIKSEVVKCAFGMVNEIRLNLERFSFEKQQLLKSLVDRPILDTSIVSPSGFFRIHFNLTGNTRPNYNPSVSAIQNAQEVAIAADSSFNFEVNYLGYPPTPSDNGGGGDNRCDIYITDASGAYGFTTADQPLGDERYTTFIQIHYSFEGFPTEGLNAMRVTVAHEFHHTIQMGNYILRFSDVFFHELTSVSMEEFVYDDVNDYYFYMGHYFNHPEKAFGTNPGYTVDGYDLAIWNIFLKDKFGFDIIKRQWQLMAQNRALEAIDISLNEIGTTFGSKLNEFGIWTYFTSFRTLSGKYFEEANNYPPIKSISTIQFNSQPLNGQAKPTSNNFLTFVNSSDTLVAIISNTDVESGINNMNTNFDYQYKLSSDSLPGSTRLTNDYFADLNVSQPSFWSVSEILNYQVIRQDSIIFSEKSGEELYAYPNPFYYNKSYSNGCDCITILIDPENETGASLNVYTSGMKLVYESSSPLPIENNSFGRKILKWDIRSIPGQGLASGVYIYAIKLGSKTSIGKVVIFNE
jgi:hypothetical protein